MASYFFSNLPITGRYHPEVAGFSQWAALAHEPTPEKLNILRREGLSSTPDDRLQCPRIFISHRQPDVDYALRIAWLASRCGFEYWLDVLEPDLTQLSTLPYSTQQLDLLTAGIIEMGLMNSTHVIVVLTHQTAGSLWVPYEYGRITAIPTLQGRAAAWQKDKITKMGEYMLLGVMTDSEQQIEQWFAEEKKAWIMQFKLFCPAIYTWKEGMEPTALPKQT